MATVKGTIVGENDALSTRPIKIRPFPNRARVDDGKLVASETTTIQPDVFASTGVVLQSGQFELTLEGTKPLIFRVDDNDAATYDIVDLLVSGPAAPVSATASSATITGYTDLASFPAVGVTNRLYLALDTGLYYRWTGSVYTEIVTKVTLGLENVDNVSDADKPVSTAQQTALDSKADLVGGTVPVAQLPSYVDDVLEYADYVSLPATGETGKIYVTLDTGFTYRWTSTAYLQIGGGNDADTLDGHDTPATGNAGATEVVLGDDTRLADSRPPTAHGASHGSAGSDPVTPAVIGAATSADLTSHLGDLGNPHSVTAGQAGADAAGSAATVQSNLDTHEAAADPHPQYTDATEAATAAPVQSVASQIGNVVLAKTDVGLGNVDNTADTGKPVSTVQQAALDLKATMLGSFTVATLPTGTTRDLAYCTDCITEIGSASLLVWNGTGWRLSNHPALAPTTDVAVFMLAALRYGVLPPIQSYAGDGHKLVDYFSAETGIKSSGVSTVWTSSYLYPPGEKHHVRTPLTGYRQASMLRISANGSFLNGITAVHHSGYIDPSTTAEEHTTLIGFLQSSGGYGDPAIGIFFRYTHTVNGGRWELVVRESSVDVWVVDSGSSVLGTSNDYHSFDVVADLNTVKFYIDYVLVGSYTGAPLAAMSYLYSQPAIKISRGAGTDTVYKGFAINQFSLLTLPAHTF